MLSAASVSQFVCQHDTSERLNVGWWNLAVRCTVQKSRPRVQIWGLTSRSSGTKNENVRHFSGAVLGGASCVVRQFYAGGKISACCPVKKVINIHLK